MLTRQPPLVALAVRFDMRIVVRLQLLDRFDDLVVGLAWLVALLAVFRIARVEKFVWQPAPFQSPSRGFGSKVTATPWSSQMRCMM